MKRTLTFTAILLLVVSVVGPPAVAGASSSGLVGVPDSNIHEDLPSQAKAPGQTGPPSWALNRSALTGSVMASSNAETLEVTVTTRSRAQEHAAVDVPAPPRGPNADPQLALIFADNESHAGRTVAIPKAVLRDQLGYFPETAFGYHDSGDEWTAPISSSGELVTFRVPKFSSNVITFSATAVATGTGQDGSTVTYNLSDLDGVSDPVFNLTGVSNTEQIEKFTTVDDGSTTSVSVEGTEDVDLNLSLTSMAGHINESAEYLPYVSYSGYDSASDTGTVLTANETGTYNISLTGHVHINDNLNNGGGTATVSWGVYDGSISYSEVTSISSSDGNTGETEDTTTLETNVSLNEGDEIRVKVEANSDSTSVDSTAELTAGNLESAGAGVVSGTFAGESYSSTYLNGVETWETSRTVSPGSSYNLDVATETGNPVNASITGTEETLPTDPGVKFNSNWINHTGTLADGETVSYTGNSSWIQEGTNTVEISLPELSADAPTPKVGFEVSHEASSEITTEYASDAWQESYNVSTTFSATKESPTVEIPFSGTVYRVPYIEEGVNGSSWTTIPSDRYSWDGSTLTIQLDDGDGDGDVDADTDYAVRVAGQRMDVQNGQVTVTDPIAPGDDLDVGVRIDQKDSGLRIGVGGTQSGHLIHYPYQESWSNPAGQAIVESGGVQYLELPNAPVGGTLRVTTTPLEVAPDTGAASVTIDDPDGPVFKIGPGPDGPGDDLTIKYHGASSGNTYDLYSRSRSRDVGTDTAESPAIFEEDDSEEIFEIQLHEDSGGGGDGGGGGFPAPTPDTPLSRYGIVAGWALLVVLLAYGTGKSDMDDRTRWALLGITTVGGGLLTLEVLNPGSVSTALGQAIGKSLEELLPLAGLAGIGIVAYSIYMWWKRRQTEAATPETQVAFNLRGDNK